MLNVTRAGFYHIIFTQVFIPVTLKVPVHVYRPFLIIIGYTENIFPRDKPIKNHSQKVRLILAFYIQDMIKLIIFCIIYVKVGIDLVIFYNFDYVDCSRFRVFKTSLCSGRQHFLTLAVFTDRIDIGKMYTIINPLYSLARFIAFFIRNNTVHLNSLNAS